MADISGYLNNIKTAERGEDVRDSIINALDKINKDNPITLKPLNVTANGTYTTEGSVGYNSVTVQVPEGASSAMNLTELSVEENGEYTPEDGAAFSSVKVDVPIYENEISPETTFNQNGIFDPLEEGYDGWGKITINVSSGGTVDTKHRVIFCEADGTPIQAVADVPDGAGAMFQGVVPTRSGMRFVGWRPNPVNVKSDMKCYATYVNIETYSETEILDDWKTIAKKCRQNPDAYQLGQWKLLECGALGACRMQLVGKLVDPLWGGNGYAPTTWIGMDLLSADTTFTPYNRYVAEVTNTLNWTNENINQTGWLHEFWTSNKSTSHGTGEDEFDVYNPGWHYLHNTLWNQYFPKELKEYLQVVIKYSLGVNWSGKYMIPNMPSKNYLWIPSNAELVNGFSSTVSSGIISLPTADQLFGPLTVYEDKCPNNYFIKTLLRSRYNSTSMEVYHTRSINNPDASNQFNLRGRYYHVRNDEYIQGTSFIDSTYTWAAYYRALLLGFCL